MTIVYNADTLALVLHGLNTPSEMLLQRYEGKVGLASQGTTHWVTYVKEVT